ncbi:hypothetical protein AALB64_07260 [Lachnospiraceae bacterium 45-P1]
MELQIILLYAGQYQITDETTGEIKQGVTCNFYFNTDLRAEDNKNGSKGTRPAKGSIDFQLMKKIKSAPALYNAKFEMSIGSDGKPVLKILDLDYVSDIFIGVVSEKQSEEASEQPAEPASESQSLTETSGRSGKK